MNGVSAARLPSRPSLMKWTLVVMVAAAGLLSACGDDDTQPPPATGGAGGMGGSGQGGPDLPPPPPGDAEEGLQIELVEVTLADGGASVEFTITDAEGRPLDLEGLRTPGAVEPRFVLSWLGENEQGESTQYTAYTVRTKETEEGDAVQSSTDADGTFETLELGRYRYEFATTVQVPTERRGLTHTVGVYATRTVDDVRYVAVDTLNFVPDGSEVNTILDVVTTQACNECHTRLEFHGGARRGVELCNLCHTEENSLEPLSGNTIDFQVMIHKIHMGRNLPSVQGGEEYFFFGFMDRKIDYSDVGYPWNMADCAKCHQGSQGERWRTRPDKKPCVSCHDRTFFGQGEVPEGYTLHTAGPRLDNECVNCHAPDKLFPMEELHRTSLSDPDRPKVTASILGIEGTDPGSLPRVEFEVRIDGEPVDLLSNRPNRLRLSVWGPSTGVDDRWSETIEQDGSVTAVACGAPAVPPCLEPQGDGFVFHASTAISGGAAGTYYVGLDGRYAFPDYGNIAFVNPVSSFAVTGDGDNRRPIVTREACNTCHGDLGFHGGSYQEPLYCLNCHNTTGAFGSPLESGVRPSLNLKDFIHRVHTEVAYPAPLNDCSQCHVPDSVALPLEPQLAGSTYVDPDGQPFIVPPQSAACTSCHDDAAAIAHAETNSGMSGEACGVCHREGKDISVTRVHQLSP